jgi:hypothetical protein
MCALGAAESNTTIAGFRWRRILRRKPEAECRTASALNAPRRYWVRSEKAQPRLVVRKNLTRCWRAPDYWNCEDYGAPGGELKNLCCLVFSCDQDRQCVQHLGPWQLPHPPNSADILQWSRSERCTRVFSVSRVNVSRPCKPDSGIWGMTFNGEDLDAIVRTVRFDGRQQTTGGATGAVFARQLLIASAINPRAYLLPKEGSPLLGVLATLFLFVSFSPAGGGLTPRAWMRR